MRTPDYAIAATSGAGARKKINKTRRRPGRAAVISHLHLGGLYSHAEPSSHDLVFPAMLPSPHICQFILKLEGGRTELFLLARRASQLRGVPTQDCSTASALSSKPYSSHIHFTNAVAASESCLNALLLIAMPIRDVSGTAIYRAVLTIEGQRLQ
jgi:hypothetical protein